MLRIIETQHFGNAWKELLKNNSSYNGFRVFNIPANYITTSNNAIKESCLSSELEQIISIICTNSSSSKKFWTACIRGINIFDEEPVKYCTYSNAVFPTGIINQTLEFLRTPKRDVDILLITIKELPESDETEEITIVIFSLK